MRRGLVVVAVMCVLIAGCDDHDKQAQNERRIQQLEAQVKSLQQQLATNGNPASFDDCVLSNMKGVNSDLAAESVKESCLRKMSVPMNDLAALQGSTAGYGNINGYGGATGLHLTIENGSAFTITELTIAVKEKQTGHTSFYDVSSFPPPLPPGVVLAGRPRDITEQMRLPPGRHSFTVEITETVSAPNDFFNRYSWGIVSAKGYRS